MITEIERIGDYAEGIAIWFVLLAIVSIAAPSAYLTDSVRTSEPNDLRRFTQDLLYITHRTYGETGAAAPVGCATKDIFPSLTI